MAVGGMHYRKPMKRFCNTEFVLISQQKVSLIGAIDRSNRFLKESRYQKMYPGLTPFRDWGERTCEHDATGGDLNRLISGEL